MSVIVTVFLFVIPAHSLIIFMLFLLLCSAFRTILPIFLDLFTVVFVNIGMAVLEYRVCEGSEGKPRSSYIPSFTKDPHPTCLKFNGQVCF